jgi:hypothetical protein
VCIRFCADFRESALETLVIIIQSFGEEDMTHMHVFEWKIPNSPRLKKLRQVKNKARSMLMIHFDMKGIVLKEFVLASQTVSSAYYSDVL